MDIFTTQAQMIILPTLAVVFLVASLVSSHQEVKGHFSFFSKLIIGFCIGAFALDIIAYIANGRHVSLGSANITGYDAAYKSSTSLTPSSNGSAMPWDGIFGGILNDLLKYVIIVVGGIAFVIGGIVFMFGIGARAMHLQGWVAVHSDQDKTHFAAWKQELDHQASLMLGTALHDGCWQAFRPYLPRILPQRPVQSQKG